MRFIKIAFVFLATLQGSYAYDGADVRFEVEKVSSKHLVIKAFEGSRTLFTQAVDPSFRSALIFGQNVFSRHGSGYKITYKGRDETSLGFEVDEEGNISIENSDEKTGFADRKSWGFKTPGIIQHSGHSLFFKLFIKAHAFHNHGILKSYTGEFLQNYLFNQGIIHFGNETDYGGPEAYLDYVSLLRLDANPSFQYGIIDDYGVILAEKGLRIRDLTHKIHGLLDVDQGLELKNASIENTNGINVSGPITGTVNRFTNQGFFTADTLQSHNLAIREWSNTGNVYLARASDILSQDKWDNTGAIFVGGDTSVGSRRKPDSLGLVVADGVIKALIEEALDEAASKELFGKAAFISKRRKIILDILHHTDHYLNTITRHSVNGRYTHTTETGDIFQRRTTEKKQIEKEGPEIPEEVDKNKTA